LLTSPHNVPHPFFQQPNAMRAVHAGLERLIETIRPSNGRFCARMCFALNCLNWWGPQIWSGDEVRWFHGMRRPRRSTSATSPRRGSPAPRRRAMRQGVRDHGARVADPARTGSHHRRAIDRPLRFEEWAE
jgi:hypothetical protein